MAKRKKKIKPSKKKKAHPETKGLVLLGASLLFLVSLITFSISNPYENWLGYVGHFIAFSFHYFFGLGSYFLLGYLIFLSIKFLTKEKLLSLGYQVCYFSIFLFCSCILLNVFAELNPEITSLLEGKIYVETMTSNGLLPKIHYRYNLGGVPFYYLYRDFPYFNLKTLLSNMGVILIFSTGAIISFILLTKIQIVKRSGQFAFVAKKLSKLLFQYLKKLKTPKLEQGPHIAKKNIPKKTPIFSLKRKTPPLAQPIEKNIESSHPIVHTMKMPKEPSIKKTPLPFKKTTSMKTASFSSHKKYHLPSPHFLSDTAKIDQSTLKKDFIRQAKVLESTLNSFGIGAKVGQIHCGPTITSFEVHPPIGVKVQKIKALENDIALNMEAKSIRIIAPIPGKAAVGVEIPAIHRQEVSFKEMLYDYQQSYKKMQIPILLGQTVSGENVITDLTKMPHCLIAGATGSGKSVCINTLVMSILMNTSPNEVRLMMIDPKKVELTQYSNLPHMIAPVISEAHGAYAALHWLVKEMQSRYDILKKLGLRNITAFNKRKQKKHDDETIPETLPLIVGIIDEFADLMMVSSSDLETPIARIAQMARAVGIHLVLATQRPSREVITGIIKANFPCRIAFKVASRINSQIILDETGAESLLGNGDLLFLPPGSSQLVRAQGVYVSDEDINKCVEMLCMQAPPDYLIDSFDALKKEDHSFLEDGKKHRDDLYDRAFEIVTQTKNASTTYLQRKLKIGYARAASLMDELEDNGVIGPQEGSRTRKVLM